jgi:hypothetical protein
MSIAAAIVSFSRSGSIERLETLTANYPEYPVYWTHFECPFNQYMRIIRLISVRRCAQDKEAGSSEPDRVAPAIRGEPAMRHQSAERREPHQ